MTDSTREMLTAQVDAQLSSWIEAMHHATGELEPEDEEPDCEHCAQEYEDVYDVLNTEALSVEYEWEGPTRSEATVRRVVIVLATGGPHVEIVATLDRGAEIVGYWGGEKVTRYVDNPATLELAESLAEQAEMSS